MKAMPFLVADTRAVTVQEPVLRCGGAAQSPADLLEGWDYLQPLQIAVGFSIDEALFREQTALTSPDDLDGVVLGVQVDCLVTRWRTVSTSPVQTALDGTGFVEVVVPPGTAAQQVVIQASVLLDRPDEEPRENRAAHLRGSRLFVNDTNWRVALEGEAAGFPTDAFNFSEVGLAPDAPWHLAMRGSELNMPFMKAVRLQINTGHPAAEALLNGTDKRLRTELFHDVLLQMILAASPVVRDDQEQEWEEDSLGYVLDGLCDTYLHTSLPSACDDLTSDPTEFLTALKAATGLLKDYES